MKAQPLFELRTPEQTDAWRGLPWQMFTACSRCGELGWCAGRRRSTVRCFACFTGPRRRRRP